MIQWSTWFFLCSSLLEKLWQMSLISCFKAKPLPFALILNFNSMATVDLLRVPDGCARILEGSRSIVILVPEFRRVWKTMEVAPVADCFLPTYLKNRSAFHRGTTWMKSSSVKGTWWTFELERIWIVRRRAPLLYFVLWDDDTVNLGVTDTCFWLGRENSSGIIISKHCLVIVCDSICGIESICATCQVEQVKLFLGYSRWIVLLLIFMSYALFGIEDLELEIRILFLAPNNLETHEQWWAMIKTLL